MKRLFAALALVLSTFALPLAAQGIISEPTKGAQVAISQFGNIGFNDSPDRAGEAGYKLGFRRGDGADVFGATDEAWGAAIGSESGGAYTWYNEIANGPTANNLTNPLLIVGTSTAMFSTHIGALKVEQAYSFETPNALRMHTMLTNTGSTAEDIRFSRGVVWGSGVDNTQSLGERPPEIVASGAALDPSYADPFGVREYSLKHYSGSALPYFNEFWRYPNIAIATGGAGMDLLWEDVGAGESVGFSMLHAFFDLDIPRQQEPSGAPWYRLASNMDALGATYTIVSTKFVWPEPWFDSQALAYRPLAVPEPATWGLLAFGLVTVLGAARRRRSPA